MTPAQKKLKELRERQSRERQRMAELGLADSLTDETRAELDGIEAGTPDLERQIRAATLAVEAEEGEQRQAAGASEPDSEHRARLELRSRASLGRYLAAALAGRLPSGAEAELAQAAGVRDGAIPLELFDVPPEQRADAATPAGTTTGVNLDPILPRIYARAVLPRLGVAMPRVESGTYTSLTISSALSAAAKAPGVPEESSAATFAPTSTTPHRVSARLSLRIEDIASIGTGNFESVLRQNLMLALSDRLDHLGLTGNPATDAAQPIGLFTRLNDPADQGNAIDFNGFVSLAADGIDGGPWAEGLQDVVLLVNPETQRLAERTFQTADSYQGETSAATYLRKNSGGFFSSRRMPVTASNIAPVIRCRMATKGLEGVDAVRLATCPVWAEIGIDDIYSGSASGTRHFTLHSLIGDVVIQQPDAYDRVDAKLA